MSKMPIRRGRLLAVVAGLLTLAMAAVWFVPMTSDQEVQGEMPTPELPEELRPDTPHGKLVIMGGSERFDNTVIWSEIVRLAGGDGARIAVFPTASGDPLVDGQDVVKVLNDLGADAFLVPVALRGLDVPCHEAVIDPVLVEGVRESRGVFFVGGSQSRICQALLDEEGQHTPMLDAIWDVHRKGGVIAGTSAGAAVMSRIMYRNARSVLGTLLHGVSMGRELDHGLGFLNAAWFVEQHCLVRGRFARSLVAMREQGFSYGVGVDEDTALVVDGDEARVIGYRGALIMDLSDAQSDDAVTGFNVRNAKLTYLDRGDSINLRTLDVTPSSEKAADRRLEPSAPDFRPHHRHRVFCNDILGNMAVYDVMRQLLDNQHDEAIGLAFDGSAARQGSTPGFEFRFYRADDTMGWETEAFGGVDYTIVNIHVDVTPITIQGPLYAK